MAGQPSVDAVLTDDIVAAVLRAFVRTGASTPGWPDPHPDRRPRDDEYSRCLDPAKYRIVAARIDAWTQVLTELELATAEPVTDPATGWSGEPPSRLPVSEAWRLRPRQAGAIPLLVCLTDSSGATRNGLLLGAGDPATAIDRVPGCGCDACDSGSADLLQEIDERVLDVVTGAFVHVTTPEGTVTGWRNGWSASGIHRLGAPLQQTHDAISEMLREAASGRSPYPVVRGDPWW